MQRLRGVDAHARVAARAADPQSKEVWVEALRNHVGLAEAPLRNLEVLTAEVLADAHLLDLCRSPRPTASARTWR